MRGSTISNNAAFASDTPFVAKNGVAQAAIPSHFNKISRMIASHYRENL
jgi:hypothetical protein